MNGYDIENHIVIVKISQYPVSNVYLDGFPGDHKHGSNCRKDDIPITTWNVKDERLWVSRWKARSTQKQFRNLHRHYNDSLQFKCILNSILLMTLIWPVYSNRMFQSNRGLFCVLCISWSQSQPLYSCIIISLSGQNSLVGWGKRLSSLDDSAQVLSEHRVKILLCVVLWCSVWQSKLGYLTVWKSRVRIR